MRTRVQDVSVARKRCVLHVLLALLLLFALGAPASEAQVRLVVRDTLGLNGLLNICNLLGCSVQYGLGDPQGQLFLVDLPQGLDPLHLQSLLTSTLGIVAVEPDQVVSTLGATAGSPPQYLTDRTPVPYYGTTVWRGYITQPAYQLIRTAATQSQFGTAGSGIVVAIIDTGVDTTHPVLKSSLVTGYDFTRNQSGGSEMGNAPQTESSDYMAEARVSQSTVAVLEQSTVAVLEGGPYEAFGHGTMVAGIVHLVAPQSKLMPLKAFNSDGSGYDSNILRAIYYAVGHGAKVINMSFEYGSYSPELKKAVDYAASHGVILVAAAGNDGSETVVYPGGLSNVIDVASTDLNDVQSAFTNYGAPPVWLTAPGEGIMTTYPYGTYAAGWGTSFSAPFVSGTAALMAAEYSAQVSSQTSFTLGDISLSLSLQCQTSAPSSQSQASNALSHAQAISNPELGYGRLDTYQAVDAWTDNLGLVR